jgi:hypothetical protein
VLPLRLLLLRRLMRRSRASLDPCALSSVSRSDDAFFCLHHGRVLGTRSMNLMNFLFGEIKHSLTYFSAFLDGGFCRLYKGSSSVIIFYPYIRRMHCILTSSSGQQAPSLTISP